MRWVHQYSPEIEKKVRRYLRPTNDSWRMDETYIRVKGEWKYLYRAVDSNGNTIDFMLSAKRNKKAAKRFLKKALGSKHNQTPRVITVDKNPAYPPAVNELKNDRILPQNVSLRQIKYLNNIVESDDSVPKSSDERKIRNADICQIGYYIIRGKDHEGCPSFRCQKF